MHAFDYVEKYNERVAPKDAMRRTRWVGQSATVPPKPRARTYVEKARNVMHDMEASLPTNPLRKLYYH